MVKFGTIVCSCQRDPRREIICTKCGVVVDRSVDTELVPGKPVRVKIYRIPKRVAKHAIWPVAQYHGCAPLLSGPQRAASPVGLFQTFVKNLRCPCRRNRTHRGYTARHRMVARGRERPSAPARPGYGHNRVIYRNNRSSQDNVQKGKPSESVCRGHSGSPGHPLMLKYGKEITRGVVFEPTMSGWTLRVLGPAPHLTR